MTGRGRFEDLFVAVARQAVGRVLNKVGNHRFTNRATQTEELQRVGRADVDPNTETSPGGIGDGQGTGTPVPER